MTAADQAQPTATILRGIGGHYLLHSHYNNFQDLAMLRGILRLAESRPLPGDKVIYGPSEDPDIPYIIEGILPRKSFLARPAVANLDLVLITIAASRPRPDLTMVDRLIVMSYAHGIEVALIINKMDQKKGGTVVQQIRREYKEAGTLLFETGFGDDGSALEELRALIRGRVVSFAGQSGTGKSTLLNRLFGTELMETGELSDKIGRGRHTTRHTELFPLKEGGYLADTPGFSQVSLAAAGVNLAKLADGYAEIKQLSQQCRFAGCAHTGELGCAVSAQTMSPGRYERYLELRAEVIAAQEY
ncbi:MAG: ribosome small subunit-dependent GTPase A [Saccharofermentanales bacterium]|jgi:ribosome biogenesis GTPase|nr:ribosome small subunit-dependent GTPase A [Bacillota bacterium]